MTTTPPHPQSGRRRTAIVTGSARGIGAAIAHRLAADGMSVGVVDLDEQGSARTANAILESGGRAIAVRADVANEQDATHAVDEVAAALGPVTVLVNNAGIIRDNLIFKMPADDWDRVLDVHLRGAFLMTRAAQAHMTQAKWGRIVSLSSTSALGNRGQVNYAAAKAGLQGFTKTLALELGKFGVTANAIAPGVIDTDMTQAVAERLGVDFEDWKAAAAREIPVGRVGRPDDVAAVASFLCSEEAGYVSGQVIYVAGGPKA
jgi:3-oxoacyl-[acyl-carrier protein] reductase